MKKLLLLLVCVAFVWCSCSKSNKEDIAPKSTISATIAGTNQSFDIKDTLRAVGSTGVYLSGGQGVSNTADRIAFILGSPSGVKVGTYSSPNEAPNIGIQILYEKGGPFTNDYYYNYGSTYPATITVTSVNATNIQGTFSGTLILESTLNTASPQTVTITDGKFNVMIQQ
ncbi:MAG TPA: hypothetical protein VK668_19595 [Mucilaginibacter sp.]|nr:hypothetical protein [Mucilaginibacter sp.]